ncbi:hypothetical protein [Pseudomonas sp. 5P_5.1_Bac1]|uniref:hypothetical protein n=1 Tax=Pseudomonas sp. 5P_5.1_Bac1 TaxID=2971616 RepID=UPI0021C96A8D|nr:hypothetical protein [Pseudomonas sp. 5P_5.1_Bac1]MCU1722219.1 hypothetical protein [Pseudomonas sp. 5P_5.1_Bac1]
MIVDQGPNASSVCVGRSLNNAAVRCWLAQYKAEQLGGPIGNPLTGEQQRIRQIEQQAIELKMGSGTLKNYSLLCPRIEVIHQMVRQLQHNAHPVTRVCLLLRITHWSLDETRQRQAKPKSVFSAGIGLKAAFVSSADCYDSRRLEST